jgi:hypothetical protein
MRRSRCSTAWEAWAWIWTIVMVVALSAGEKSVQAENLPVQQASVRSEAPCGASLSSTSSRSELEGMQIETSDMELHERFFSQILHASEVQRIDHPQVDVIRGYCYRDVLIVVRQDIKTPRPTGWVQLNFAVAEVAELQQQFEQALRESDLASVDDAERAKIVRLRFKPDVPRSNCRVARLEVNGPEGFMIGFDQFKEGSCKTDDKPTQGDDREHRRPHH